MATKAGSKVAKQRYVDTLDVLSRQSHRYLEKLRIVDVDPYKLLNSAWSKSEASFPAVSYPDIVNYLTFTKSFYTMEDMEKP